MPFYNRSRRRLPNSQQGGSAELVAKNGRVVFLGKPLASGALQPLKRVPRYWRSITIALARGEDVAEQRLNGWLLVLAAKKIPHLFFPKGKRPVLYVPPLWEGVALHEICAFEAERSIPIFIPPARSNVGGVLFFLFLLIFWHGMRWNWFAFAAPSPFFPATAAAWAADFGLDVYRTRSLHEWWRTVTALTMHADDAHLFSNIGFGLLFLIPLCRRAGLGLGLALTVAAGITGNACNALFKAPNVLSIGFSTALFGAVGALCALTATDIAGHQRRFAHMRSAAAGLALPLARRLLLPLAAGMALLGILGGGGEAKTDYAAHIWGFCCGLAVTVFWLPLERAVFALPLRRQAVAQGALFAGTLAVLALCWLYAFLWSAPK